MKSGDAERFKQANYYQLRKLAAGAEKEPQFMGRSMTRDSADASIASRAAAGLAHHLAIMLRRAPGAVDAIPLETRRELLQCMKERSS